MDFQHNHMSSDLLFRTKWDRQARESQQAFQAFELYRDMGPHRGIRKVGKELGKSFTLIERWSRIWDWSMRIRAYEDYYDLMKQKALHDRRMAMIDRQAKLGADMQDYAAQGLQMASLEDASIGELASLAEKGVKIERLAFGDSTENNANSSAIKIVFEGPVPAWAPDVVKSAALEGGDDGGKAA